MTISSHHEPLLLAVEPPYGEEHFNRSEIFKNPPQGFGGEQALNPFFCSFSKVILTSMFFS